MALVALNEKLGTDNVNLDMAGTTHVLRLSWSPDGQYVLSAHAMNGGGPTAQVVERDGWRCDKDFVGHRKAVTCAVSVLNSMIITTLSFLDYLIVKVTIRESL